MTTAAERVVQDLESVYGVDSAETALNIIHALRARFDMVGTEFYRSDVTSALEGLETDGAGEGDVTDLIPYYREALADEVMEDYGYRKMADRLAEVGNEIVGSAAYEVIGMMQNADSCGLVLDVSSGEETVEVEETFANAAEAHERGMALLDTEVEQGTVTGFALKVEQHGQFVRLICDPSANDEGDFEV